jgi:putative transposase
MEGWLFVVAILALFSRMVVGWAMGPKEDGERVEWALRMALARRRPEAGLLHHADRGSEFTCDRDPTALRELGIEVSMSRTANCWENAALESFLATRTKECRDRTHWQTRQQARSAIFEYLECFYNPIRLQSTLQSCSPLAFARAPQEKMR